MEHPTNPELETQIGELEALAYRKLENPDGSATKMSYRIELPGGLLIRLRSIAENTGASMSGEERCESAIFIEQTNIPEIAGQSTHKIIFSCFIETVPRLCVNGLQNVASARLPQAIEGGNDQENTMLAAALAFARWLDGIDKEATAAQGQIVLGFDFEDELPSSGTPLVAALLNAIDKCLVEGASCEHKTATVGTPPDTVYIESRLWQGPPQHYGLLHSSQNPLTMYTEQDGLEHQYVQLADGGREVRVHLSDDFERYRNFESFEPVFDEDGALVYVSIDDAEIRAHEARERSLGLYQPTPDNIELFLKTQPTHLPNPL